MGKCVSRDECLARNNAKSVTTGELWFLYNGECLSHCPEETEYNAAIKCCEPCGNKCIKYCYGAELNNKIVIDDMKGCTHINGSLSILNVTTKEERVSLYENLRSLRYIRDYLLIARNEIIEDLQFLKNVVQIDGENLYANKSLFVYDNRNLKKLWNTDQKSALKITRGNIGFHDNELLCLTEIERFTEEAGINYTETDVSKYSNGVYCYEGADIEVIVNITEINTDNATIVWESKYGNDELYYTVHYTDSNITDERLQDVCSATGWDTFSTANNSAQLVNLRIFTKYQFYIQIFLKNMQTKKTSIKSFQTLPDDPDSPSSFASYPVDHSSIRLVWTKPHHTNGNLSKYIISIYREDDDPYITRERDYCTHPFSEAGSKIDKPDTTEDDIQEQTNLENRKELYELGPSQLTYPDKPCTATNTEINIRMKNNIWLYLCDKNSRSKFGINLCKTYYYNNYSNNSDANQVIQKRSGEKNISRRKPILNTKREIVFNETVGANVTNHTITNLKQFSMYVFYILACNEEFKGLVLCSSVLQSSARTLKNPHADDVLDVSVKVANQFDVIITWSVPSDPNSFILAYNIYYRRNFERSKNQSECITGEAYLRDRNFTLKNMLPGGYYVMVQAVSLAGPGNMSDIKYIEINDTTFSPLWFIVASTLILLVILGTSILYYRMKTKNVLDNIQLITRINPDYTTLSYEPDEWEMDRDDIEFHKMVGQGTFGRVYFGRIKSRNMACAVKTVNEEASFEEKIRFLAEASTMKQFTNGIHVVKLYGVVSQSNPPLVVMELMERGDLKNYLQRFGESSQSITSNEIYRMAIEIADGLAYLSFKKHVHRDLAARNCLVSHDRTVKIGDFGLTRDIYQSDYYKKGSGNALLPVRWMAPESIADGVYTYDSDIWSYGIVLWEIVTLASQPYQGLNNEEVTQFVVSKGTLHRPAECPNLLWEIMKKCWDWYPMRRPTCFEIIDTLQGHVGSNFQSLSFYHSTNGQEYLTSHGSARPINPPALAVGGYNYEDYPISENEPFGTAEVSNKPSYLEFIPPSRPLPTQSSVRVDSEFLEPLMSDSDTDQESQL